MLKFLVLMFSIANVIICKEIEIEIKWLKFKTDYNKLYMSFEEEQLRKSIWLENFKYVESFELLNPNATFKVQINEMSDKRVQEGNFCINKCFDKINLKNFFFKKELLNSNIQQIKESLNYNHGHHHGLIDPPDSFDWRTQGLI